MPVYQHTCRTCELDWEEEYTVETCSALMDSGRNLSCPKCAGEDTYRNVTTSGAVIFAPGGVGWADNGYYQFGAYDAHKAQGKSVKRYDRKEDLDRDIRGEAEQAELSRLKKVDEAARRNLSPDAGLTQPEAEKKIKAAGQKAIDR